MIGGRCCFPVAEKCLLSFSFLFRCCSFSNSISAAFAKNTNRILDKRKIICTESQPLSKSQRKKHTNSRGSCYLLLGFVTRCQSTWLSREVHFSETNYSCILLLGSNSSLKSMKLFAVIASIAGQ